MKGGLRCDSTSLVAGVELGKISRAGLHPYASTTHTLRNKYKDISLYWRRFFIAQPGYIGIYKERVKRAQCNSNGGARYVPVGKMYPPRRRCCFIFVVSGGHGGGEGIWVFELC